MIYIIFACILLSILILLIGCLLSKDLFSKILAANSIANYAIVLLCLISIMVNDSSYIDIAIIYSLVSIAATTVINRILL
jgi:multisubunit Na+/H+ antiporter MnhF subunit